MLGAQHCPEDVLCIILSHLSFSSQGYRAGLCLVCRAWSAVATPLLYSDIEPGSIRSLKSLLARVRKSRSHASLIRKLRFPHFNQPGSDGGFLQVRYHRDRFADVPVYEVPVAKAQLVEAAIDALASIFFDLVDQCPNLVLLDLPLYRVGYWCLDPSKMSSLRTLTLQGHGPNDPSTQQWQIGRVTRFLGLQVYLLPNLDTMNLCMFNYRSYVNIAFPQVRKTDFPSLKTVCTHDNDITALLQFSALYHVFSHKLERTVIATSLPFWRYEDMLPSNIKFTKRLELTGSTSWSQLELGGSPFSLVTTLFVELYEYINLASWILELPPALETFILSFRLKAYHPSRPFLRARAIADVRDRLAGHPKLQYFRITWSATKRECDIWKVLSFCLHEMFLILGIRLHIQLRLGMSFGSEIEDHATLALMFGSLEPDQNILFPWERKPIVVRGKGWWDEGPILRTLARRSYIADAAVVGPQRKKGWKTVVSMFRKGRGTR